jgi:hypothetical protein
MLHIYHIPKKKSTIQTLLESALFSIIWTLSSQTASGVIYVFCAMSSARAFYAIIGTTVIIKVFCPWLVWENTIIGFS